MEKTLRILILEDVKSDADLMEFELVDAGFSFIAKRVMTENAYLQGLEEFNPDLILSDYHLPQYTGMLALIEAKKRRPEVPFILVTGASGEIGEMLDAVLARGAAGYVLKNRLESLVPAVKKVFSLGSGPLSG
ncbi:MAG: response regulator [Deltaproteobacteria bacterium]|nr:response regulator [Deltaproteobacteria bacterium]